VQQSDRLHDAKSIFNGRRGRSQSLVVGRLNYF